MSISIGIDLGTTNSVLAYTNQKPNGDIVSKELSISRPVDMYSGIGGNTKLNSEKKATLPSCVYYVEEQNYKPIVGDFAKNQYSLRAHLVAKSIKSQMGNIYTEGLSPDIPDKTPAQVSARILKHMIKEAEKSLKTKITDAIITVPANFDPAMCKATRDAAEIAGINVRNSDGTEKPILLSEPNAVIYNLFNQVRNGEIPSTVLDLSSNKTVMVFDIGGGTLDITIHEIKNRNGGFDGTLKVDEIATNRYTLLGGDDFDKVIAEKMYERYLKQCQKSDEAVNRIKQKKNEVMSQLITYAENLKIELNESIGNDEDDDGWFDDENDFPVGGNISSTGYSYDDTFTQEEIEDILSIFMADNLVFDDYKRIESISNTRNIIFPILDVLDKASKKLDTSDIAIDAVILNGGMSKFYMIKNRLTEFFGFKPIEALNPDLSVAHGAAVYHYLMSHGNNDLSEDMRTISDDDVLDDLNIEQPIVENQNKTSSVAFKKTENHIGIEWGKSILNDSLYLGMKNGAVQEIIPTGAELPYSSSIMKGFKIQPGQSMIAFPIKSRNLDGSYRIIAKSTIAFKNNSNKLRLVAFNVEMDINKVITMNAWTYDGDAENNREDIGTATIVIDNTLMGTKRGPDKMLPPSGSKLDAKAEIETLLKLCNNFERTTYNKSNVAAKIKNSVSTICSASNQRDFAPVIIKSLRECTCNEAKTRLFIIARRMMSSWSENEKKSIAMQCMNQIGGALSGFPVYGTKKNTNIQAIYTLAFCGSKDQFEKIKKLHSTTEYYQACLYLHAISKTSLNWLVENFCKDVKAIKNGSTNYLQQTAYSIGLSLNCNKNPEISKKEIIKIINNLKSLIDSGNLIVEQLTSSILALGWICDKRNADVWELDYTILSNVIDTLNNIEYTYDYVTVEKSEKVKIIAKKLIEGQELTDEDEQFLLEKITI